MKSLGNELFAYSKLDLLHDKDENNQTIKNILDALVLLLNRIEFKLCLI